MNYISVQKIAQIRLLCKKVLPAVYDESLSYLEGLSKLTFKVNEVITSVNALNDNVDVLNDSVTELNARVEAVEQSIDTFESEITARFEALTVEINKQVDDKLAEVDQRVSAIELQMAAFENSIHEQLSSLEHDLTALVNAELIEIQKKYETFEDDMKWYIYNQIQDALKCIPDLTTVYVIDPTTGKLSKIQDVVNNMFIFSSVNAFTCDEFNALGLTINQLNSIKVKSIPRGMTIYEWLREAKLILVSQVLPKIAEAFAYPHSIVFNYLDGSKVWHDKNVDINQQLIAASGCYCCDELNTMGFTVNEIIGFNITCYEYVMRANKLMVRA